MDDLLKLQEADLGSKGTGKVREMDQFSRLRQLIAEIEAENVCLHIKDLAVNGNDLMALGLSGREIGTALNRLLELVLDEQLPNEKQTLLAAVRAL